MKMFKETHYDAIGYVMVWLSFYFEYIINIMYICNIFQTKLLLVFF